MTPGSFQDAVCQRFDDLRLAMLVVLMPLGTASI